MQFVMATQDENCMIASRTVGAGFGPGAKVTSGNQS